MVRFTVLSVLGAKGSDTQRQHYKRIYYTRLNKVAYGEESQTRCLNFGLPHLRLKLTITDIVFICLKQFLLCGQDSRLKIYCVCDNVCRAIRNKASCQSKI